MQGSPLIARLRRRSLEAWVLIVLLIFKIGGASLCETHAVHAAERGDTAALLSGIDSADGQGIVANDESRDRAKSPPSPHSHAHACTHCGCCAHAFAAIATFAHAPLPVADTWSPFAHAAFRGTSLIPATRPPIA